MSLVARDRQRDPAEAGRRGQRAQPSVAVILTALRAAAEAMPAQAMPAQAATAAHAPT